MKKMVFISVLVIMGACFIVSAFADDFYVIPVNNKCGPCKGTRSSGGRWCNNHDGTITDMTTCLVWLKYADWGGTKPWRSNTVDDYDDAHTRASSLKDGDVVQLPVLELTDGSVEGDWRLPTIMELFHIIQEGGETVSSSNMQLFVGVHSDYYWTSTTFPTGTQYGYRLDMTNGANTGIIKTNNHYVWPVRISK